MSRLRPAPLRGVVPAHHRWVVARRWVEGRASRCPAPVGGLGGLAVVPGVGLGGVPVVVLVVVPVVVLVAVVHHAAGGVAVVAARNSSRWTFLHTRRMMQPYPMARWCWSVPAPPRTSARS